MKLLYSPGSPYARKVRVVVREKGLLDIIDEVVVNPNGNGAEMLSLNPLAEVLTLQRGGGSLFDSPLICEYLDGLSSIESLIPRAFEPRIDVLRLQAIADGVMGATRASFFEARRTDAQPWLLRREETIRRSVGVLAESWLPSHTNLGSISVACALHYLSFRCPDIEWRNQYPSLGAWLDLYVERPSFCETAPPKH
jgi:glutathione S-transferase